MLGLDFVSVLLQSGSDPQLRRGLHSVAAWLQFYRSPSQSSASVNAEHQLPAELPLQCLAWTSSQFGFSPAAVFSFKGVETPSQFGFGFAGPPRGLQPPSMPNIIFQPIFRFLLDRDSVAAWASVRQRSSASMLGLDSVAVCLQQLNIIAHHATIHACRRGPP